MARRDRTDRPRPSAEDRAESLKERVYVTFTSLAVVIALRSHADELTAGAAATTLVIVVGGTLLAVFVADLLSHLTVHARLPTTAELRHLLIVIIGAAGVVVVPLICLAFAGLDAWSTEAALRASSVALLGTLVLVGYLAVRRIRLPGWQKAVVLLAEFALGAAVIALELLAHG